MVQNTRIFVYGTLKKGFIYHKFVLQDSVLKIQDAFLCGFLMYDLGLYPGIKRSRDGSGIISGELLTIKKEKSLEVLGRMDELEDYIPGDPRSSYYIRMEEEVCTIDKTRYQAWVYVLNVPLSKARLIKSGVWSRSK